MTEQQPGKKRRLVGTKLVVLIAVLAAVAVAGATALLVTIMERK